MKKKILLLLIVIVGIVAYTPKVSAKTNATIFYKPYPGLGTVSMDSGIMYAAEGNKNLSSATRGQFKIYNEYIRMGSKEYRAWCVDPSLHAPSGAGYTCTPIEDPGLQYVFDNLTSDEIVNATAFRFYAIFMGIGMNATDKNGNDVNHTSLNYPKSALTRYLQTRNGVSSTTSEFGTDYTQFLYGNTAAIEAAYNIAAPGAVLSLSSNFEKTTSGDGSGLKFTRTGYDTNSVSYNVTSTFPMKQSDMEFECENCASVDVTSWSDYSVSIKVNMLPGDEGCQFTVYAKFNKSGIYGCYGGEGNQFVVVLIDDPQETKFPFKGQNPECGSDCCEEGPLDTEITGSVANCCEETTHSYVKEYDLDELFCYHDGLKVDKYWEKCGADAYLNSDVQLNDYCDMYCTERVTIDVPGAITAKSGRYFTLSKNPAGNTTSPYIQGFKRCRIRVEYDRWEKDYIAAVKEEVNRYNEYQLAAANYHFYVDAGEGSKGGFLGEETITGKVALTQKCRHKEKNNCPNGEKECYVDDNSVTGEYSYSYTKYHFSKSLNYQSSTSEQIGKHDGILVKKGKILNATHAEYTVYDRATEVTNAETAAKNLVCPKGQEENGEPEVEEIPDKTYANEKFSDKKTSLETTMKAAATAYDTAVSTAKALEEALTECDDFFKSGNGSAEVMYEFNPSMSFTYSQVYRNDNGTSEVATLPVMFKETPGCKITGPEIGAISYEGGMDTAASRYSGIYGTGFFNGKDFKGGELSYDNDGRLFNEFVDPKPYDADKLFTHDARYKAVCEWEEDPNSVNTLVPNGAVSESAESNFTKHEYEYKVFLTTYDGTFETDWSVSNIGEDGKFDQYLLDHGGQTCSGNTPTKNEMFTCTLHVEYEIVYTGKCNGVTKNPEDCDPVRNVDGLFQFKIANPSNIFPTGTTTDTGAAIAKNWTDTSEGQTTKEEIEERGKRGLTYSKERESYKFHLTPDLMRHIKNYNVSRNSNYIGGYSDFNMNCECPDDVQTNTAMGGGAGCTKCKSVLLTDLANGRISYEGQSYNIKAWSSDKSIDQVRNESHWR